jgi:uncharacterized protein (TIGR00255 family)
MKSMTGYGRGEARTADGVVYLAEAQSYNKKQFEVRVRLPKDSPSLEPMIRELAGTRFSRGAVTVRLDSRLEGGAAAGTAVIDEALAAAYLEQARRLQAQHGLPGEIAIADLLHLPGVAEFRPVDDGDDRHLAAARAAVAGALDALDAMRLAEGGRLREDIAGRLQSLAALLDRIEPKAATLPEVQLARLRDRLREAMPETAEDEERLLREIIVFTDRSDVSEEITRLRSHFVQAESFFAAREPVGRGLEFLLQEMQREVNTLGVKAAAADISPLVVEFKTGLEKIREQIQNIE